MRHVFLVGLNLRNIYPTLNGGTTKSRIMFPLAWFKKKTVIPLSWWTMTSSRWSLYAQATVWRILMSLGMQLHRLPHPRPPPPSFARTITINEPPRSGKFILQFYTPETYNQRPGQKIYPVVVNFHGGGFTLGSATDDSRWANVMIQALDLVYVSVDYRRAPEHPFPTAVEDGVSALYYLEEHSKELGLDIERVITTGFSAGANLAFTVPMMYKAQAAHRSPIIHETDSIRERTTGARGEGLKVIAVIAWYPPVDFRIDREQKRATNIRPDQNLPHVLTKLFDASYMPEESVDKSDPYLSPAAASDELLKALPQNILIYTCEWDMLMCEGRNFAQRLERNVKKKVKFHMIEGVKHAWDKTPNPFSVHPTVGKFYMEACTEIKHMLEC